MLGVGLHVVTPAGALGITVAEDALDRYLIVRIEVLDRDRVVRAIAREPWPHALERRTGPSPWSRAVRPLG